MLERFTNGQCKATGHRVRNTREQRYSIIMFVAVNDDETIAPMPQFVTEDNPAGYAPVKQRAHLDQELARAAQNREQSS